ncbi:MAG: ComEA family DNA-binding protein [Gordonia paraffinivorans]
MYLRASRDGRPDVLARLAAVPPVATLHPGASSDLSADRPVETGPTDPEASWLWDEPGGSRGPAGGPAAPRWIDDVPGHHPDAQPADDRRVRRRDRALTAPPAAIALVVIGVLACVVTIVTVASGSSDDVPTSVAFPSSAGPVPRTSGAPASGGREAAPSASPAPPTVQTELVVSVVGLVRTPGLVRLPSTARIADAIARAGGGRPGADLLGLNMAQPLHDGDQVLVGYADPAGGPALRSAVVSGGGVPGSVPGAAAPRSAAPSSGAAGGPVDLNTADAAALDALPGVGPKTAAAILEWRQRNGRFSSVDQLAEVDGIGPAKFASLRDLVRV